jgi:2-polyprenyl-3-methyl-5-hydroxy-6-metoxy-1,4-benzoquinol methylase
MSNKKLDQDYATKGGEYYSNARQDISCFLPRHVGSVLEIGGGSGETLAWIKDQGIADRVVGVDLYANPAESVLAKIDRLLKVDVEELDLSDLGQSFDVILCLDVLEHLIDPWVQVKKLRSILAPGGLMIISVPNVRRLTVVLPLVFLGDWKYRERGILDSTHLRFFTRRTALQLATSGGGEIVGTQALGVEKGSRLRILNLMTLRLFEGFLTRQYLIACR